MRWFVFFAGLALASCHADASRIEAKAFVTDKYGAIVRAAHCTDKKSSIERFECVVFTETNHEIRLDCSANGCVETEPPKPIRALDVSVFAEKPE